MMRQGKLSPVTIAAGDYERLTGLVTVGANDPGDRPAAAMLAGELMRATIVTDHAIPRTVATMHSRVEFRDDVTLDVCCATLVYPGEADEKPDRISVLSPIGAALIGLREGQSIAWRTPKGWRSLTLLQVFYQPYGQFVVPWRDRT
ncbi:nucleoside diphosphate kinase regulator [Microvirga sp. TS319]|uniref:nucleoside diphosphate kinase regulator n=1 Tax=Microvirga sp. TS319 TaxID=3241165 RepID=UPI003519E7B3